MPIKRKFKGTSRSRPFKRTAFRRRTTMRRMRRVRRVGIGIHKYKRYVTGLQAWTTNTTNSLSVDGSMVMSSVVNQSETDFAMGFRFTDLKNMTEFSNLYDQYKITGVKFMIQMINSPDASTGPNGGGAGNFNRTNFYPRLHWAIDRDDALVESVSQIKERQRSRNCVMRPNKIVKIWIPAPTALQSVASGGSSSTVTAGLKSAPWLDIAQNQVTHYGLKCGIEYLGLTPDTANQLWYYKIEAQYYFKCKDVR